MLLDKLKMLMMCDQSIENNNKPLTTELGEF